MPTAAPPIIAVSEQLRAAIRGDGRSVRRLGEDAEVDPGQIHRFLSGERALTTPSLDRLAAALGLELTPARRKAGRPRKR